jgi:glycosyltransferase 2 family protein
MKKKVVFSILLGGFFLWLALKNVSFREVAGQIKAIDWAYLPLAFMIGLLSHLFRALRWQVILGDIKKISFLKLFGINSVGFLFIHIIPFRIGEFAKPYLLKRDEGVRMSTGLATVAIERVFDGLILVLILVFGIAFANFKTETVPYVGMSINYLTAAGALIFGVMLLFLIILVYKEAFAVKVITRILSIFPKRIRERGIQITQTFVLGLSSLPSLKKNILITFHSIIIWLCAVLIMFLSFQAMNIDISWEASFVALGIVSLGIMLPAPPGFIGNFQLFCQGALGLYGISATTGLSYSIIVHAINIAGVFLLGFIFLPKYTISYKTVLESENLKDT